MRQWIRNEKGNVLIMVALSTAVLAGFGILTIDIGRMLVTKTQLQNAADAGALAGAGMFCNGTPTDEEAEAEAKKVSDMNRALEANAVNLDVPFEDITIERAEQYNDVTVIARSDTRQYLLGLFNIFRNNDPRDLTPDGAPREAAVNAIATARCGATCSAQCVKPWSIPDRWDNVTAVPGYAGEVNGRDRRPDWRANNQYDFEEFDDANDSGKWEPGESWDDDDGDGQYDQEAYHPSLTGYGPDPIPGNFLSPDGDLGLRLTLHPGTPGDAAVPGQYFSVDLPPVNKMPDGQRPPSGADEYRENIASCNPADVEAGDWLMLKPGRIVGPTNQGMRDLIAQDPDAEWDDATQSVVNSNGSGSNGLSPRIVLIPIHDPRIPVESGRNQVQVVKVAAFFMEEAIGQAQVEGRFLKVRAPGSPCVDGQTSGFFTYNLALIR
jgi:hypothetical protein